MPFSIPLHQAGKFFRPPLPDDHLPRQTLADLLLQAADRRLLMLCAPAGFGKSTLAIDYCEQVSQRRQPLWLSLDARDADAGHFLSSLITLLRHRHPGLGEATLRLLQQPTGQPLDAEQHLRVLLDELQAREQAQLPLLLVLDDYHLVQGPRIDRLCASLLEGLPADAQLLLTSRQPPDWHLARWRLGRQLLELKQADLRLGDDEAQRFLGMLGVAVAARGASDWLAPLLQRSEGWIAGLRLLGIAAAGAAPAELCRLAGLGNWAGDYLLEEVLEQQPEPVRDFIRQVGVLERFCAELADALREADDSAAIIQHLLRHQAFLVPLDDQGCWYRFHHLFSDMLRRQGEGQGRERRSIHLRASHWLAARGQIAPALEQALLAESAEQVAGLIRQFPLDQLLAEQHVATLLRWKAELPDVLHSGSEHLLLINAWTLALAGQLEDAVSLLARTAQFLPQPDAQSGQRLLGRVLTLQAWLARSAGNLGQAIEQADQALVCLPAAEVGSQLQALLVLADSHFCRQQHELARESVRAALELARRSDNLLFEAQAELMRARLLQARGESGRARQLIGTCLRQLEMLDAPGGLAIRGRLRIYQGYLLGQLGEQDEALQLLQQGIDEARECRDVHVVMGYCARAALLAQSRGGQSAAFDTLAEAERLMHLWDIPPVIYLAWITTLKSDLWITSGRLDLAGEWLPRLRQTYCQQPSAAPPAFFHALPAVIEQIYARLLASNGDEMAAESLLRQLANRLQQQGERLQQLSVLISLVRLLYRLQRPQDAERCLLAALALADRDNIAGPFRSLLLQAPEGLAGALQRAPASALRDRLLALLPIPQQLAGGRHSNLFNEPLSNRELDVLRCIAQGYSNEQISQALFISLHTVKSHARRINHKLGVARRTQAVAQAKRLGLLG